MEKESTEEIRMEIESSFVKKHEYWVKHQRGKNWIARITGMDPQFGYKREFLQMVNMGREKVFELKGFKIGEIYEIASEYYTGSGNKQTHLRDTFVCKEINETHIVLQYIAQEEVVKRFTEGNGAAVAESLAKQLLKVVSPEEARNLIDTISGEVIYNE